MDTEFPAGRVHLWTPHMPMAAQARCWCQPFVVPDGVPFTGGLLFHRPVGTVFREYGEQGPMMEWQQRGELA
jgi:hypothetical protein